MHFNSIICKKLYQLNPFFVYDLIKVMLIDANNRIYPISKPINK